MYLQAPQVVPQADNGGPPPASGRASYRGGGREYRPGMAGGEGVGAPVEELAAMSLQRERGERRRFGEEPHTRPAHITDKTGKL